MSGHYPLPFGPYKFHVSLPLPCSALVLSDLCACSLTRPGLPLLRPTPSHPLVLPSPSSPLDSLPLLLRCVLHRYEC